MRNVIVLVLLFCLAGCNNMTASVWDERDNAIGGRLGYVFADTDEPNNPGEVEIGGSIVYWPDGESAELFGAYAMYKFPNLVEVPNPILLDFLPATLKGTPYIGGQVEIKGDDELLMGGIEINNALFIEYRENRIVFIGLKHKF